MERRCMPALANEPSQQTNSNEAAHKRILPLHPHTTPTNITVDTTTTIIATATSKSKLQISNN